jgi:hypothetical protein
MPRRDRHEVGEAHGGDVDVEVGNEEVSESND